MRKIYLLFLTTALFYVVPAEAQFYRCWGGNSCNGEAVSTQTQIQGARMEDRYGSLVIADDGTYNGGHQIRIEKPDGKVYLAATTSNLPTGVTLAPNGNIVYSTSPSLLFEVAGVTSSPLNANGLTAGPVAPDVAIVGSTLYIADPGYGSSPGGLFKLPYPVGSAQPVRLLNGCVGQADCQSNPTALWGSKGVSPGLNNSVIVSDSVNGCIRRYSATGVVTTIAGVCTQRGYTDGPVAIAQLGIVADAVERNNGDIYFADASNHVIRLVRNGQVSTVACSGQSVQNPTFFTPGVNPKSIPCPSPSGITVDEAEDTLKWTSGDYVYCLVLGSLPNATNTSVPTAVVVSTSTNTAVPPTGTATATATAVLPSVTATVTATKKPTRTPGPPCDA